MNIQRNDQYLASSQMERATMERNIHHETGMRSHSHSLTQQRNNSFSIRPLTLDTAVAPLLNRPNAPFDKTERKRAHTSAVFYSECFLRGIEPVVADTASEDIQKQYQKWWVKATTKGGETSSTAPGRKSFEQSIIKPTNNTSTTSSSATPDDNQEQHVSKFRRLSSTDGSVAAEVTLDGNETLVSTTLASDDSSSSSASWSKRQPEALPFHDIATVPQMSHQQIHAVKMKLYKSLRAAGGSTSDPEFLHCTEILQAYYKSKSWDGRRSHKDSAPFFLEGQWLTISKPTYNECQGLTPKGEYLYSLGRLAFDMFKPTGLVCSLQAVFNSVRPMDPKKPHRPLHVPRKLMKEIQSGQVHLRTYDIVVAFTIEGGQTREGIKAADAEPGDYVIPKPIKGILTNQGYVVPDPDTPNRLSIWFSGGSLEVQDEEKDLEEWKHIFDTSLSPNRNLKEYANILAAKLLLGALLPEGIEADGTMSFSLKRPIGGHGSAFVDIVYMDDDLRIMRGHQGSLYVCTRVPQEDDPR